MSVTEAVERELKAMPAAVGRSAVAAAALAMAGEIDDPGNSATSKSMCSKELREAMTALRALAPAKRKSDQIDDLTKRRAKRLTG